MPGRKKELESSEKDLELPAIGGRRLSQGSVGENPPFYFDDYTNTDNFCIWLEKVLCPELRPGQVVIMDNASFHKSPHIREIIEHAGCQLLYLPPYSPDLNPIENYWAWLKHKLSRLWRRVANFYDRLSLALNLNYGATSA